MTLLVCIYRCQSSPDPPNVRAGEDEKENEKIGRSGARYSIQGSTIVHELGPLLVTGWHSKLMSSFFAANFCKIVESAADEQNEQYLIKLRHRSTGGTEGGNIYGYKSRDRGGDDGERRMLL